MVGRNGSDAGARTTFACCDSGFELHESSSASVKNALTVLTLSPPASPVFPASPLRNLVFDDALILGVLRHLVEKGAVDAVADINDKENRNRDCNKQLILSWCGAGMHVHGLSDSVRRILPRPRRARI